jgi:hypothetical protein
VRNAVTAVHARRPPRLVLVTLCATLGLLGTGPVGPVAAESPLPGDYRVVASEVLAPGVEHQTLQQDQPFQIVHVARLAPGLAGRLLPVRANDVHTGPSAGTEPTSSMCTRVRCLAAVNGDYADASGSSVGAMVVGGELITTPAREHVMLRVDGQARASVHAGFDWSVGVTTADGETVPVSAVNRSQNGDGVVLYSRSWGASTGTDATTTEVALSLPPNVAGGLPSGSTRVRVGPAQAGGNAPIPAGQVVLSGRGAGAGALTALSQRAGGVGVLTTDVGGLISAIGGSPQLLQSGNFAYPDKPDSLTQERHPRTAVGITPSGETLLVSADGRGDSAGLTLREAAQLLSGLGAVHAINLDGGGSTTFVTGGSVRNVPSDGSERPVVSALAIVAGGPIDSLAALLKHLTDTVNAIVQPPS